MLDHDAGHDERRCGRPTARLAIGANELTGYVAVGVAALISVPVAQAYGTNGLAPGGGFCGRSRRAADAGDRLLEDGGIGRHARDRELVDVVPRATAVEQRAADVVVPDALPQL